MSRIESKASSGDDGQEEMKKPDCDKDNCNKKCKFCACFVCVCGGGGGGGREAGPRQIDLVR